MKKITITVTLFGSVAAGVGDNDSVQEYGFDSRPFRASLLKMSSDVETIANCADSAKALRNDWVCCKVACGLVSRCRRSPTDHGARTQVREVEFAVCKVLEQQSMMATINNHRCPYSCSAPWCEPFQVRKA